MRAPHILVVLGGALALGAALAGCPAAHNDYPGTACKINADCYVGEVCKDNTICVPIPADMSIIGDFAHPPLPTDGGPDDLSEPSDMTPVDL
ncbi:MAG TPA: hypothetical protein VN947_10475 [Polyangia bacterium]|nr:hypothetical protein [Polyangia bacterium]